MKKKKIAKYIQEAETPIKPKVLYDKVTWGDMLTENEKTFLRNVLEDESHSKDEGLGIAIEAFALSHAATRENITLVEKFLDEDFHNGIFAGTALKVLCYDYYWNLAKDYLSLLKGILLRQESDEELFSRAALALGMYLSNNKDKEIFYFIYDLFQQALNEYHSKCDWETRDRVRSLYEALRYASTPHEKLNDIYFEIEKMRFPDNIDNELILQYLKL